MYMLWSHTLYIYIYGPQCPLSKTDNVGILLTKALEINFSEIVINIIIFSFKNMHLKVSSVKWWPANIQYRSSSSYFTGNKSFINVFKYGHSKHSHVAFPFLWYYIWRTQFMCIIYAIAFCCWKCRVLFNEHYWCRVVVVQTNVYTVFSH